MSRIVHAQQIHGSKIARVDRSHAGTVRSGVDGLVTDSVNLPLSLVFADCVPLLLYDRYRHVLGVCHAGWRGTVCGIPKALVAAMQSTFGTEPTEVVACIGPSIGPASYEVGDEVRELAANHLAGWDRFFAYTDGDGRNPHFDLWQANAYQLTDAGIVPERVEISGIDTAKNTDEFFSHRAENGRCGLFCMLAWLDSRAEPSLQEQAF
jgi:YfiH family protein